MSVAIETTIGESMRNLQATTDLSSVEDIEKEKDDNAMESDNTGDKILARGKRLSYTKDEFIALKESRLSNIAPAALSNKYCNRDGVWDPELWYYSTESIKRSASPIDKKKSYIFDGIILSPQGRSFAGGCQVTTGTDKKEEGGKVPKDTFDARKKINGRTGKGWEPREKGRGKGRSSPRLEGERNFDRNNTKNSRNDYKVRQRAGSIETQPEWFTYGPSSQHDTIELKGFDDLEKGNRKKGDNSANTITEKQVTKDGGKFDINEFFDMAESALPLTNMYEKQTSGGSRFSQWFADGCRSRSNSLPTSSRGNSRRSSITDELAEIARMTVRSPALKCDSPEFVFTPIVPASRDKMLNIMQDSDVDVQPLLDSVIPHQTVKGAVTLTDLEGNKLISVDKPDDMKEETKEWQGSQVFERLVKTMKASGNLPEKPTPTIPDIPPHLLPRPPSSKEKSRSIHNSRSPSPLQLLQEVICQSHSPTVREPSLVPSHDALPTALPFTDTLPPVARPRPLTPEDVYGLPPVFNIDNNTSDRVEVSGVGTNADNTMTSSKLRSFHSRYSDVSNVTGDLVKSSENKRNNKVISQSFVPTSVLRKLHSNKHEQQQKLSDSREMNDLTDNSRKISHQDPSITDPYESIANPLMASSLTSPKASLNPRPELLTPHRVPLPSSPSMTPHSLPLPRTPMIHQSPHTSIDNAKKPIMTPHSLPLPQSPLVSSATSNPSSDFGIRPLPKTSGLEDSGRTRARTPKKPIDQRQNSNPGRFPHNAMAYRSLNPNMIPRPAVPLPTPFNINAQRAMNVHPTALALALRNQQYQMARAAAVAAATAAVNRPPVILPAQAAAAAAMMLNQQRMASAFRDVMPQMNPHMFQHNPQRPNLPPALQRQHHVVHHSGDCSAQDNSLSKWFSDAVLNQTQSQTPSRGAKVLSVEELERQACA